MSAPSSPLSLLPACFPLRVHAPLPRLACQDPVTQTLTLYQMLWATRPDVK
jgi:hypothetical protein